MTDFNPLTIAELEARLAELKLKVARLSLEIPGIQQKRAWALCKRYSQQIEDYAELLRLAQAPL